MGKKKRKKTGKIHHPPLLGGSPLPPPPITPSHFPSPPQTPSALGIFWSAAAWLPMWIALSVFVSVFLASSFGYMSPKIAVFGMLSAGLIPIWLALRTVSFPNLGKPGVWGWLSIALFLLVSIRIFTWGIVEASGGIRVLLPNNLGDASLHLALVNYLSSSPPFWPTSPWLSPLPLEYPPGTDMFDAMMVLVFGRDAIASMAATALILSVVTAALLWGWGRAFCVVLLLFTAPLTDLLPLLGKIPEESSWKSLMITVLAPQRGMLVALPLGLVFLILARRISTERTSPPPLHSVFFVFLPLCLLPLFSVHAFLALLVPAAWTAVLLGRRSLLVLGATLAVFSIPSAWVMGLFTRSSSLRIEPFACSGWEIVSPECLLKNFGLLLPLLIWLLVQSSANLKTWHRAGVKWNQLAQLYFPSLFVGSMVVAVSPWAWDNTKLMVWAIVGAAPFVWSEILARFPRWFQVFSIALIVAPGAGALSEALAPTRHGHEIARAAEVREALAARSAIPPGSVILAAPEYNHPWFLAGHPFFMGYEGWLWSHGLEYQERKKTVSEVLSGLETWQKKATLAGVTHILWSPRESAFAGLPSHPAASSWAPVFEGSSAVLYENPELSPPKH